MCEPLNTSLIIYAAALDPPNWSRCLRATNGQELAEAIEIARDLRPSYDRHTGEGRYPVFQRSID